MKNKIENILIIGGGSAGWMTAAYLNKAFGEEINVTLVESDKVQKLGVGEATLPSLQKLFFDFLEIPEDEWMSAVNSSFKVGINFVNWAETPTPNKDKNFLHVFGTVPTCEELPLEQFWLHKRNNKKTNATMIDDCYGQAALMHNHLSPKTLDGERVTSYAWHFDAVQVANFLRDWSVKRGVNHIIDHVEQVSLDDNGDIDRIKTQKQRNLKADLYIDCSGFRSILLQKAMKEPFIDMSDQLLCNAAVAATIPQDDEKEGIDSYTSAIAMNHGWTWKTPLKGRAGTGYVYSSKFCSQEEATREFQQLWNLNENHPLKQIKFRVGRTERSWVGNCVAIGTSSNFLEPLESTGLYFVYAAVDQLVKHLPNYQIDKKEIDLFNEKIKYMYGICKDFVQMHYFTTSREDTPFWKANKYDLKIEDSIAEKMKRYKAGLPVATLISDSEAYYNSPAYEFENFWLNANYYAVLLGMGVYPDKLPEAFNSQPDFWKKAESIFKEVKNKQAMFSKQMPTVTEFLHTSNVLV